MKHGLGRGMMSLVGENEFEIPANGQIDNIKIENIIPNRYQPRTVFDTDALNELADSIREKGVIQPVIVSNLGDGRYELVAGERRWRASKIAGLDEIPAIIKDFSDEDRLEIALIENIQRQDLNSIEQAKAYKEIMERLSINQDELAKKIGKNRSTIANTLRLLKLPEFIRNKISDGSISEGHARAILTIEDIDKMINFTNFIIENGLSVREAEKQAKDFSALEKEIVSRETTRKRDPSIEAIQENFIKSIGAKVQIKGTQKKGKIEIHYFSSEELENIYKIFNKVAS